jgi:hypothetical protein
MTRFAVMKLRAACLVSVALLGCKPEGGGVFKGGKGDLGPGGGGQHPDGSGANLDFAHTYFDMSNLGGYKDMAKGGGGNDLSGNVGTDAGSGLTGNGCAGGTCQNPTCKAYGTAAAIGMYPDTGFDSQPSYIPNDTIIPTFDDGPDGANSPPDPVYGVGAWTTSDLSWFKTNNMNVDFFINTNNWCGDVLMDPDCSAAIVQILQFHNPANHTVHHIHMGIAGTMSDPGCPDTASCDVEMAGVETVINTLSMGGRPHLTRFRAPYGEPFQANGPGLSMAQAVVAKYAVQVGWNIDSQDSTCNSTTAPCFTGKQIADNVTALIGNAPGGGGRWGILLLHATFPWTHDALPLLFGPTGYLATHGFKTATVEDAICWKYGKHSWDIVQQLTGQTRSAN